MGVTSFECIKSGFNITKENNSFSISIPGQWISGDGEELINELNKLLEQRSENDIEFHVKDVEKRETRLEIGNSGDTLAGLDQFKSEVLSELKRVNYRDLKEMVYRLQ